MNKLLTICVSWQRPSLCRKMIESFLKTRRIADLFMYICDDDPLLEEYKFLIKDYQMVKWKIGPHLYIGELSNYIPTIESYEYYQMINPINRTNVVDSAMKYKVEPYVIAADIYSNPMQIK